MKTRLQGWLTLLLVFCTACSLPGKTALPTPMLEPSPTRLVPTPTSTSTATITPIPATPTSSATPTWIFQPAGEVICPILLYHQIEDKASLYYVSPVDFQAQMEALSTWGYTAITITRLAEAISQGAELPERPVVITFDDGNQNVYTNAFPIMQALGFPGVNYIISSALDAIDHLTSGEILEMAGSGWEVGSHSQSHLNLLNNPGEVWAQASLSRSALVEALGVEVNTFAYPYGAADTFTMQKISQYGYKAAVGLGSSALQGPYNLFYLNRIEVPYGISIEEFAKLLPWSGAVTP